MIFAHFVPFVTFALGMIAQLFLGNRKTYESIINEHLDDIDALRDASVAYWLSDGSDDIERALLEAASVQVALASVTSFSLVADKFFDTRDIEIYSRMLSELTRAVTGGKFETVSRKASPGEAIDVARQCASLIHHLRSSRFSIYHVAPRWVRNKYYIVYDKLRHHLPIMDKHLANRVNNFMSGR